MHVQCAVPTLQRPLRGVMRTKPSLRTPAPVRQSELAFNKSDSRVRLLEAASELIREKGPNGASVRAICEAAGVHPPTLYHYFSDLNGLYSAVMESVCAAYADSNPPDEVVQPTARILDVWDTMMRTARKHPGIIDLMNNQLVNGHIPHLMQIHYRQLITSFKQLSKDNKMRVKPRVAAHMYWASAQGMASLIAASRHGIPLPKGAIRAAHDALLTSIFEGSPTDSDEARP